MRKTALILALAFLSAILMIAAPAHASPPQIPTAGIADGAVTPAKLAAGGTTPSSSVYYRGDGTWQAVTASYVLPYASTSVLGGVFLTVTPASSSTPLAVGDNDSRMTNSRTPNGSAGGDLTGSYPNPTLGAVGAAGTYTFGHSATYDSKGREIAAANPTGTASSTTFLRGDGSWAVPSGGSGGSISLVTSDPASPAPGTWWYRSDLHKLRVKEASSVYGVNFVIQTGKPPTGSTIDTGLGISSGLVLSYLLGEASGTSLTDSSSTADTGTLSSSGLWATDTTYTEALAFTGSQQGYFPYKSALNIETYTVAVGFKTTATGTMGLYYWGSEGDSSTGGEACFVYMTAGKVALQIFDTSNTTVTITSSGTFNDGGWHTAIATRTKSGAMALYVDSNTAVATGTDTVGATITSGTGDGRLACRPGLATGYPGTASFTLTGSEAFADEWNRVLSSSEISSEMADPFAPYR